ncbi:MAG: mannitol dehydrogenase family protein [Firmicutes bacterium]|nr:mannitol dehydrogenase family protein [Bacillota bacterium]
MKLTAADIKNRAWWEAAGIALPRFDIALMRRRTEESPAWVHFGAGNIFRAFLCAALQRVLDAGAYDRGIIACEAYDGEIIDRVYEPYDGLSLLAVLRPDGQVDKRVLASIARAVKADDQGVRYMEEVFAKASLQMVSLTVTEKAYTPQNPLMGLLCRLLRQRFFACAAPLAMVSMDNCSRNGEKFWQALLPVAEAMVRDGKAPEDFLLYLKESVAFPSTMIDKITPHPDAKIAETLRGMGVEDMDIVRTAKGTVTAAFVNAEQAEYLVVEDAFPAGRPALEMAGILFTDRETVDKVEKMKVGTCLNPLHTALAVLGCLLGFTKISTEMKDEDVRRFVEKLGYEESLPVAEDPGVLSPKAFLDEVLTSRLPNHFLPDTPQRIAADTSQKLPIRFGWTLAATKNRQTLCCVPFVFAAWLRYLTGVDDGGNAFTPSPDPRADEVRTRVAGGLTDDLLSDVTLFGADLVKAGLADKVRAYFGEMMGGKGAVRRALQRVVL